MRNLEFAIALEPNNKNIQEKIKDVELWEESAKFTVGTIAGEEHLFNPFLRCNKHE